MAIKLRLDPDVVHERAVTGYTDRIGAFPHRAHASWRSLNRRSHDFHVVFFRQRFDGFFIDARALDHHAF